MTEANKNSFKDVAKILGGFGVLVLLIHVIPNGSISQHILAALMCTALVGGIIWFTPLGNPIKRLIRRIKEKK